MISMGRGYLLVGFALVACSQEPLEVNLTVPQQVTESVAGTPDLSFSVMASSGITVSPTGGLLTSSSGATAHFTVVLDSQPLADVTIGLRSSDTTQGTVSPASLTFTGANWNQPQTVTITGVDDQIVSGDNAYTIVTARAVSVDPAYATIDPPDVSVINKETDTVGFAVTPTSGLRVTAGSATAGFTVHLTSSPTANVTIGLSSSNSSEGTVSPSSMTFTTTNWASPRPAVVTGVDDQIFDGDQQFLVVTSAAVSSDTQYNGIDPPDVRVTNVETDVAGIVVAPTSGLSTTENAGAGHTATFNIKLKSKPVAAVSIGLTSSAPSHGTVAPTPIVLDNTNWSTGLTATITGVHDGVATGNIPYTIITAAAVSTDPVYSGMNPSDVSVLLIDNDVAGITVNPTSISMTEGGSTSFTIGLNTTPTASVTITFSGMNAAAGSVQSSVTLSNATPATIVVTARGNDTTVQGNTPFTVTTNSATSSDGNYNGMNPSDVTGTTFDNDVNVYATTTASFPMQWCLGPGGTGCPAADGSGNSNVLVNINLGGSVNFLLDSGTHGLVSSSPGSTGLPTSGTSLPTVVTPSASNAPGGNSFFCSVHGTPMSGTLIVH
jgi:hypothetical protein